MFEVSGDGTFSAVAGSAIVAGQAVKVGAADEAVIPTAAAADVGIGIAVTNAASGGRVTIKPHGVAKAIASAAITRGAKVGPSAVAGRLVTAATAGHVLGVALSSAAAAGDYFPVLLQTPPLLA